MLSRRIPHITATAVKPAFQSLVSSTPALRRARDASGERPTDYTWAIHPGGSAVLDAVETALGLTREHTSASWYVYENFGNNSSATILSVLERLWNPSCTNADKELRQPIVHDKPIVAVAFGPGVCLEMLVLAKHG